jgi:hypothetical protein
MPASPDFRLYAILIIAAAARLLMQSAAMPPYAGLDEAYHVARLSFVRAQGRNPMMSEPSVPQYIERSIANDPHAAPAFCVAGPRWWEIVPGRRVIVDQPVDSRYLSTNYEAQQPSLYYSIAARLVPARSALFELRAWRLLSVFFALIIVAATALIGERAMLAAAMIVSLPTWETLVVRAGNDAFACAAVTMALVATVYRQTLVEVIAWPLAIAAKLYTWPMLIVLPILWREQRAGRRRIVAVAIACAAGFALTIADLMHRTRNPLGLFAFDPSGVHLTSIRVSETLKIWIATFAWTSGPHFDALRPLGIAIYMLPVVVAGLLSCWVSGRSTSATEQLSNRATLSTVAAFAVAQMINAAAYARSAQSGLPAGGKEGWYWYALAPIVVPFFLTRFRALALWIVAWDVLITEVALFHDYSGATSPLHPTALFRWGPWHWPFTAQLDGIGVGPFVAAIVLLRLIHLAAFGLLWWRTK